MLGNFSIGDYFRDEVIPWAFELLTSEKWFGFPKEKLYITYYPDDIATRDLWIKCGMDPDHMIPSEDNFGKSVKDLVDLILRSTSIVERNMTQNISESSY